MTPVARSLALLSCLLAAPAALASPLPAGFTCNGHCGSMAGNGAVALSPSGNPSYLYVTTALSGASAALPTGALGSETNGSSLATPTFTAAAGSALNFWFDYVTSDGGGNSDYSWAELFHSNGTPDALLFTARTTPSGSSVSGAGLPAPAATLHPGAVPILPGTTWSALGDYSGGCFDTGCGHTGWINANYNITAAGAYYLVLGVTNWDDLYYDSALAVDGFTLSAPPPPSTTTPEPATLTLLGSGLLGLGTALKRRLRR